MRKLSSLLAIVAIAGFAACDAGENQVEVPDVDVGTDTVGVPDVDVDVGTDTQAIVTPDIDVNVTDPDSVRTPPPTP